MNTILLSTIRGWYSYFEDLFPAIDRITDLNTTVWKLTVIQLTYTLFLYYLKISTGNLQHLRTL